MAKMGERQGIYEEFGEEISCKMATERRRNSEDIRTCTMEVIAIMGREWN
jgi:hypothetical protein